MRVVACLCHVDPRTVRRWCEDGTIPTDQQDRTLGGHLRVCLAWVSSRKDAVRERCDESPA